jgi:hypothetical protein
MREGDGVGRSHPEATPSREVVDRPRDDRQANAIELAKQGGDLARQGAIDEGLEEDGLRAVFPLVHRDELPQYSVGAFSAWPPSLDTADQSLCSPAERYLDETFLCRCVEVDGPGSHMGASRDLGDAQVGVPTARDLAQRGGLDRARCSRRSTSPLALDVPS